MNRTVLVHGWGYDSGFWSPLRSALGARETQALDFGFFGPDRMAPDLSEPCDVIAHSMGVLWLLAERPFAWRRLIAINGFSRFVQDPDFPDGVPVAAIRAMRQRLAVDVPGVVARFRADAGDRRTDLDGAAADYDRLAWGLDGLMRWDGRTAPVPDLILAGAQDRIAPLALVRACWPDARVDIAANGDHVLPLSDPAYCAARIEALLRT